MSGEDSMNPMVEKVVIDALRAEADSMLEGSPGDIDSRMRRINEMDEAIGYALRRVAHRIERALKDTP